MAAARFRIVARLGNGSPLSPYVTASLLAHVAFVAAVLLMPNLGPHKSFPDSSMVVALVAAPSPPRGLPAAAASSAVPPDPPAAGLRLETEEPPPVQLPPAPERPKQPPPRKEPPRAADPVRAPNPAGTAPASGPPARASAEGGTGSSITALDAQDERFAWYADSVAAALYSQWRRPILEGLGQPIEVRITFEIQRDGRVVDLQVAHSSGLAVLDRSALGAVTDASPLPPLPATWSGATLPAAFVFKLVPE